MKLWLKEDYGSALGLVLIFVSVLGLWLGGVLILIQASTASIASLAKQNKNSTANAEATASVFEQLNSIQSLGSAAYVAANTPQTNCGITDSKTLANLNSLGVSNFSCAPVITDGNTNGSPAGIISTGDGSTGRAGVDYGTAVTGNGTTTVNNIVVSNSTSLIGCGTTLVALGCVSKSNNSSPLASFDHCVTEDFACSADDNFTQIENVYSYNTKNIKCSKKATTIVVPAGVLDQSYIRYLNEYTDGSLCKPNSKYPVEIEFDPGQYDLSNSGTGSTTWTIDNQYVTVMNLASDATMNATNTSCQYSKVMPLNPTSNNDFSGTQIFLDGISLDFSVGNINLCGPNQVTGISSVLVALDSTHVGYCQTKHGSALCPSNQGSKVSVVVGSGADVHFGGRGMMDNATVTLDSTGSNVTFTQGVLGASVNFNCSSGGGCAFPAPTGSGAREMQISFTIGTRAITKTILIGTDGKMTVVASS